MARVPLLTSESDVGPEVREIFESVEQMGLERFMNQFAALAHHPALMRAMHGLMQVYYQQSTVDKKYLELAVRALHDAFELGDPDYEADS